MWGGWEVVRVARREEGERKRERERERWIEGNDVGGECEVE